jgi:hypothetical protein
MMKMRAAAAIGALILAASAAPAVAGGYWDGGIVRGGPVEGPPPGYSVRDCPCYCPRDREDVGDRWGDDRRGWSDERDWSASDGDGRGWSDGYDSGWQGDGDYEDEDYAPADYSDNGYGVGPEYVIDEGGGGGFAGGFANVGLDFDFRDGFRDHFRDRDRFREDDRFHDHDTFRHDHQMMRHDDHQLPQHSGYPHMGSWGSMQHPTHMIGSYGHAVSRPAMHGGTVIHGGGGRHR